MNKKEFIKLLRKPLPVYVNVQLTESDCWYIQANKSNLLLTISDHSDDTQYQVIERDSAIYID